jgi:hypothetical protein
LSFCTFSFGHYVVACPSPILITPFVSSNSINQTWLSIPERSRVHYINNRRLYCYHCVDTVDGGLLVHDGIIRPLLGVLALTWCIRYMSYRNIQFLSIVIII